MQEIVATDIVRLEEDVPELDLSRGEVGRVVSTWFHPNTAFEVEFPAARNAGVRRVLLLHGQIARE